MPSCTILASFHIRTQVAVSPTKSSLLPTNNSLLVDYVKWSEEVAKIDLSPIPGASALYTQKYDVDGHFLQAYAKPRREEPIFPNFCKPEKVVLVESL